jgi:hypothetical protein
MKLTLKYLVEDVDRHRNVRCYVRIPGRRKVRIRGVPWSDEFMAQYKEAIAGRDEAPRQARAAQRGSFRYLSSAIMPAAPLKASMEARRNGGVGHSTRFVKPTPTSLWH